MRDLGLEDDLKHRGIPFKFREQVPLSDINVKGSHQNPARLGLRTNQAVIDAVFCTIADRGGTKSIEAVVCSSRHHPMDLLDGVNRCEAATEADQIAIDVYEITTPDEFLLEFTAGWLNNRNGMAPMQDQRLRRAVELADHWPDKKVDEIAKLCSLKADEISDFKKLREQAKRADDVDVRPQFNGLKPKVQKALARITFDSLFAAVVMALADSDAKLAAANDLINRVAKARNEAAARAAILEWKEENPPNLPKPKPGPETITGKFRRLHVTLFNAWPGSVERVQLGSLNVAGLEHLLGVVIANQERGEQTVKRLRDLINTHQQFSPPKEDRKPA